MSKNKHLTLTRIGIRLRDELHVIDAPPPEDMRELLNRSDRYQGRRFLGPAKLERRGGTG